MFRVSPAPHIKSNLSSRKIMYLVMLALLPAGIAGVYIYGLCSLKVIFISMASCVLWELLFLKFRHKDPRIVLDGSALLTGLLLAYNLPPEVPFWIPVVGAWASIILGKQLFGGLGHNIFNPALVGRVFLQISWPVYMTTWKNPRWALDSVSTATPLAKEGARSFSYIDLFLGNHGGCIGEVCILALLIGVLFLIFTNVISFHTPLSFFGTVMVLAWIFGGKGIFQGDPIFHLLAGGLILGAFFMATDYVTSPLTRRGKIIFGIGCGLLTILIRLKGGYPEGVSYAILFMNAMVPMIDRYTKTRKYGLVKKGR